MKIIYPVLVGEIAARGIKKVEISAHLSISSRALHNKLTGTTSFTWEEVCLMADRFFPDVEKERLLQRSA